MIQTYKSFRQLEQKKQNISPVKQRILQFVEQLNISKRQFYENTSISRGTLDNYSGITEETLAKLFAKYKNINPIWLFTGNGDMLLNEEKHHLQSNIVLEPQEEYIRCKHCIDKERIISNQAERIEELKDTISILKDNCSAKRNLA